MKNKKLWNIIFLVSVALLITGCIFGGNKVDDEKLIKERLDNFAKAFQSPDMENFLDHVSDPFYITEVHFTKRFFLMDIEEDMEDDYEDESNGEGFEVFEFTDVEIKISGKEAVVETIVKYSEPGETEIDEYRVLVRLAKIDSKWLITYFQSLDDPDSFPEQFRSLAYEYGAAHIRKDATTLSKLYKDGALVNRLANADQPLDRQQIREAYEQEFLSYDEVLVVFFEYDECEEFTDGSVRLTSELIIIAENDDEFLEFFFDVEWILEKYKDTWQIVKEAVVSY